MSTAIYVHDETSLINFYVYDPKGAMLHKQKKKNRVFLTVDITKPGIYEFQIEGHRVKYFQE
jgi:hypothetical protein